MAPRDAEMDQIVFYLARIPNLATKKIAYIGATKEFKAALQALAQNGPMTMSDTLQEARNTSLKAQKSFSERGQITETNTKARKHSHNDSISFFPCKRPQFTGRLSLLKGIQDLEECERSADQETARRTDSPPEDILERGEADLDSEEQSTQSQVFLDHSHSSRPSSIDQPNNSDKSSFGDDAFTANTVISTALNMEATGSSETPSSIVQSLPPSSHYPIFDENEAVYSQSCTADDIFTKVTRLTACTKNATPELESLDVEVLSPQWTRISTLTRYEVETGIVRKIPSVIDHVVYKCTADPSYASALTNKTLEAKAKEVLDRMSRLDIVRIKRELPEFLRNRYNVAHAKQDAELKRVPNWSAACSVTDIFRGLGIVVGKTIENEIDRASGQIYFCEKIDKSMLEDATWPNNLPACFDKVTDELTGPVTGNEKKTKRGIVVRNYDGGKRWLLLSEIFGGTGAVFVFALASKYWHSNRKLLTFFANA